MAKGFNQINTTLDAGESRPVAPIGSTLDVGGNERLYIYYINLTVLIAAPGSCTVSTNDGQILTVIDMSIPFNTKTIDYQSDSPRTFSGRQLPVGSPLIVTVTGGQVSVDCSYEVR